MVHTFKLEEKPHEFFRAMVHQGVCSCGWRSKGWVISINEPKEKFELHLKDIETDMIQECSNEN